MAARGTRGAGTRDAGRPCFRIIDHTADLGIEVTGRDLAELFAHAAQAMFQLIARGRGRGPVTTQRLTVTGQDPADLLVNWLRELLYQWSGRERLLVAVTVLSVADHAIYADIATEPYQPASQRILHEIKAVTYHRIAVVPIPTGFKATIIFDV
jgi:SHS2 domain-containing protein